MNFYIISKAQGQSITGKSKKMIEHKKQSMIMLKKSSCGKESKLHRFIED